MPALAAVVAVLVRLAFATRPLGDDEAGFLVVGRAWHADWPWGAPHQAGAHALYGAYWVDRPPLLITLYRAAALLGGAVPLRLLGCLATALVVLGCARVAGAAVPARPGAPVRTGAPARASAWAAVVAAALLVDPLTGGLEVNGELLAAPFVVLGLIGVHRALAEAPQGAPDRLGAPRRVVAGALVAGAAAVAAALVKQNILDVFVLAGVAGVLSARTGALDRARLRLVVAGFAAGAVGCLVVVGAWTLAHGTSLVGVYEAMYPFRLAAARVLASQPHRYAQARLATLLLSWLAAGGVGAMGVVGAALAGRRLPGPFPAGLASVVVFDLVSIALGGSFWTHYLLQLVPPLAILVGMAVARCQPTARAAAVLCAAAAVLACATGLAGHGNAGGAAVGRAIGTAADPGDTLVVAWGHADVVQAAGLPSPYPQLWSLPARTLDPRLHGLDAVLAGPSAPTWLVTWTGVRAWPTDRPADVTVLADLLDEHYRAVGRIEGHTVYLHDGTSRPDLSGAA